VLPVQVLLPLLEFLTIAFVTLHEAPMPIKKRVIFWL
jgi:hypothetical protein